MQLAGSRLRLSISGRAATAPGFALGLPFGLRGSTHLSSGPSMAAATGDARASAGSTPTPAKTGRSSKASLRSFAISAIGCLCWIGSRDAGRAAASRSIRRTGASSSFGATGSGAAGGGVTSRGALRVDAPHPSFGRPCEPWAKQTVLIESSVPRRPRRAPVRPSQRLPLSPVAVGKASGYGTASLNGGQDDRVVGVVPSGDPHSPAGPHALGP